MNETVNTMFDTNIDDAPPLPDVPGGMRFEPAVVRDPPKQKHFAPNCYQEDRVEILLEASDAIPPSGQFFGINGVGYMLKPNLAAAVPKGMIDILNNAIMSVPTVDPNSMQIVGYTDRLRFPYRVLRMIPAGTPIEKKD